ncbi:two-partner secretion domain-containing protein [Brunnivagina elsteri]|uniref:Filamentous hemagglutinin n=1 Tax=Brunnivagina elsteri CCALA 953 TaxID=987040 RepID=A0A2A2TJ08_9CYAN|nr:filamentous hemagglutinin N-terminal domain-containing protein [Calothrix elsteri]PAX54304.1 filamentous hemagglutinin [Calothrix elsteri CCALA 953]
MVIYMGLVKKTAKYKLLLLYSNFSVFLGISHVCAQIIPDRTLPTNSTVTETSNTSVINGGTQVGGNLFHSFERFDIPTNTEAIFNNPTSIQNILTRVTGTNTSQINGVISSFGGANLFLINPNGIIFGENARLNIGGSFVASSANSIKFADGSNFSTVTSPTTPLLTITAPIGLGFGNIPGAIAVQGSGHDLTVTRAVTTPLNRTNNKTGLQVSLGKTLGLIGGNIALNGGKLTAASGHVELGSVDSFSEVTINPSATGFSFGYGETKGFDDIELYSRSLVDVSGTNAGSIQVFARQVSINDGSILWIQNRGTQRAGNIDVSASDRLTLTGTTSDGKIGSSLVNETIQSGGSGDVNVTTQRLEIRQGSSITSKTFNLGTSGNININAGESIRVSDFSPIDTARTSNIIALTVSTGNAGDVSVNTKNLSLFDGSSVASFTQTGSGSSGGVFVKAENIEISGVAPQGDRSTISSSSLSSGNAGRVNIDTANLSVTNGGSISSSGFSSGSAGSVTINASDFVDVHGKSGETISEIRSAIRVFNSEPVRRLLGLPDIPQGKAGDVEINARSLNISDGARGSVENLGIGDGGTLRINSNLLMLKDKASITANTKSGVGGNILIQSQGIQMLDNSNITATAQGNAGNGGNISIDTSTLVAVGNSDISANAQNSSGGRVVINATGIFGTQFRPFLTPESDITASSAAGANGVVDINSFYFDSNLVIVELPETVRQISEEITTGCKASDQNKFIITGRGGLPEDPTTVLRGETIWSDLRIPNRISLENKKPANSLPENKKPISIPDTSLNIVEANGWITDAQGRINLIVQTNPKMLIPDWRSNSSCSSFHHNSHDS